jgi:hypothetical protein
MCINRAVLPINASFVEEMPSRKKTETKKKKLQNTFEKVRVLSLATPRVRKQLIQKGGKEIVGCVSECCINILKGNVPLNSKQKAYLTKHKKKLRVLSEKKTSLRKKKQILQSGGFPLAAILAPVASVLGSLLFR